ncbi:MAG: hypothetical protein ACKVOW_21165 [Chitinophagaceae bacterium]
MRKLVSIINVLVLPFFIFGQNVGIGTNTPTHAKLEVDGAVGNVVGIFGNSTFPGLSLNYSYPELGFNYYFSSGNKAMAAGFASLIGMDPTNGNMYFSNFNSNQAPGPYSDIAGYTERMTLKQNGRFGIGISNPNAQLSVSRGTGVDGTAAFFGTTHVSHFNYGNFEDTYIRPGKDNRFVFINDVPNGLTVIGRATTLGNVKLTVGDNTSSLYKGMDITGSGGSLWPAIDAHGKNGSPAITIDGYIKVNPANDNRSAYQLQTQRSSPGADGFLSDTYTPGPGSPDGTVYILINNALCNDDPNVLIYYSFVGYYENNKNYQSYLSYNSGLGRWYVIYKYDVYAGFVSNNFAPNLNILIIKQ